MILLLLLIIIISTIIIIIIITTIITTITIIVYTHDIEILHFILFVTAAVLSFFANNVSIEMTDELIFSAPIA